MKFEIYPGQLIDGNISFTTNLSHRLFKFTEYTGNLAVTLKQGHSLTNLSSVNPPVTPGADGTFLLDLSDVYTQITASNSTQIQVITIQRSDELATLPDAPTGFSVEATATGSKLIVTRNTAVQENYTSYNFYAARESGGLLTGYIKLNSTPVSFPKTYEQQVPFYQNTFTDELKLSNVIPGILQIAFNGQMLDSNTGAYSALQELTQDSFLLPASAATLQADLTFSTKLYTQEYSFTHARTVDFPDVDDNSPLYYVVTAISYDATTKTETESAYSLELPSTPVVMGSQLVTLPQPTRENILEDVAKKILAARPDISLQPGSVIRDLTLDPFSFEFERIRFILDFFYRSTSFSTLTAIDGNSSYLEGLRQALYLSNASKAQEIIDSAFDKLATNFFQVRQDGIRARGQVLFYTTVTPTASVYIPTGTIVAAGGVQFKTLESATLDVNRLATYRDPITNRYVLRVLVEAIEPGTGGNVGPNQIRQVLSLIRGMAVTNDTAMFGGTPKETNQQLYERCSRLLASVDSGTAQGYRQVIAGTAGVLDSYVAGPDNRFMFRDYSEKLDKSIAGKVDLWVQGYNAGKVQESFSVDALISYNQPFEIYDVEQLQFRLKDPDLASSLVKILNVTRTDGTHVLGFKRGDTYSYFDLVDSATPATLASVAPETGILTLPKTANNSNLVNSLSFATPLLGDIQLKSSKKYVFKKYQPVTGIESVTIDTSPSGTTTLTDYTLYTTSSPFLTGNSTDSEDYIVINSADQYLNANFNVSYEPVTFTNTRQPEYLSKYGIYADSIVIYSSNTNPTQIVGSGLYTVSVGSETALTGIKIANNSTLKPGDTVYVSYTHRPNITVNYTTNLLVSTTQLAVDARKHMAADVKVKAAFPVALNVGAVVTLQRGVKRPTVALNIKTNVSKYFSKLKLGDPVRQSDIIEIIDATPGVAYVDVPLTQLARADGSVVIYEPLTFPGEKLYGNDTRLDGADYSVYRSDSLYHQSLDSSEMLKYYSSVIMDHKELTIITDMVGNPVDDAGYLVVPKFTGPYQAAILNDTSFTGSRVFITGPKENFNPLGHQFHASYIVSGDKGPKNIELEDIEYAVLGELLLQFGEDS